MTLQEKIERRSSLIAEAKAIINKNEKNISSTDMTRFDSLMDGADRLQGDINREERSTRLMGEQRSVGRPPRSQPGAESPSRNAEAEKRAFRDWMRTGQISQENRSYLQQAETRALGVGAVSSPITGGNVLVPVGFDPQLHSALLSYGQLAAAVRNFNTDSGEPYKVALDDDTANSLTLLSELTAAPEVDPNVAGFISSVDTLSTGLVQVSNQLLTDSAYSVNDFITNKFGARYYRGLAKMIAQGNGSNIQKLTPGATITAALGGTNSVTLANLNATFGELNEAYLEDAVWVMSQATKVYLMDITDNYGRPLLQPDVTGKPFNSIYGKSIVISQYTDPLGPGKTPILFGSLPASYTLRTVGGLQIARSVDRYFELNATAFVGWARVGGYSTVQSSSPSLVGFQNSAS